MLDFYNTSQGKVGATGIQMLNLINPKFSFHVQVMLQSSFHGNQMALVSTAITWQ